MWQFNKVQNRGKIKDSFNILMWKTGILLHTFKKYFQVPTCPGTVGQISVENGVGVSYKAGKRL